MRGPPLKLIIQWIFKAWPDLDKEINIKSFRYCPLSIQDDASEDNEIACFKPLSSGLERLIIIIIIIIILKAAIAEAAKERVDPFTDRTSEMIQVWLLIWTGKTMKTLILSKQKTTT